MFENRLVRQYLEGPEENVRHLVQNILKDERIDKDSARERTALILMGPTRATFEAMESFETLEAFDRKIDDIEKMSRFRCDTAGKFGGKHFS